MTTQRPQPLLREALALGEISSELFQMKARWPQLELPTVTVSGGQFLESSDVKSQQLTFMGAQGMGALAQNGRIWASITVHS